MSSIQRLLDVAKAEVGYVEGGGRDGRSGNITKYWAEDDPALQGESWCAMFVSWVYQHAGAPLPAIDRPYGFMNCADAQSWAKRHGKVIAAKDVRPGDIVLFGFGSATAHHTGIVRTPVTGGGSFTTYEGNTSSGDGGSQTNGGGVYMRLRYLPQAVLFFRPLDLPSTEPLTLPSSVTLEGDDENVLREVVQMPGGKFDDHGRAYVVTTIPWLRFRNVIFQGVHPGVDGWTYDDDNDSGDGLAWKAQERDGNTLITVKGGKPGGSLPHIFVDHV